MRVRKYFLLILAALGLTAVVLGLIWFLRPGDPADALFSRWNLSRPERAKTLYAVQTEDRWFGEGEAWVVLRLATGPSEADWHWDYTLQADGEPAQAMRESVEEIAGHLSVPEEYRLDWSEEMFWCALRRDDGSSLFLLWRPEQSWLYLADSIF